MARIYGCLVRRESGGGAPVIAVRGEDMFGRAAPPGTRFADSREPGGNRWGKRSPA